MAFLRASTVNRIRYGVSVLAIVLLLISMVGLTVSLRLQLPPDPTQVTTLQNDGPGSLRWAIENAQAGSTITFNNSLKGRLLLTSDYLHISKRLYIRGPGAGRLTISGNNNYFGLDVLPAGSISISDVTFKASYIINEGGTLTLTNSIVSGVGTVDNHALNGGGIYNFGTLTLINSTVSGNTADSGGGIYNTGRLKLISSTVSANTALSAGGGGGILNVGSLALINSTVSTNKATTSGGGIANSGGNAQTEITFCTIYGNTASDSGGGIWNDAHNGARKLVMRNSLVAGNRATHSPDIAGQLTSQGYNVIQNIEGTTFAPNQPHHTDLLKVAFTALRIDPLLKDNNGPTQTHALLPGSLAIDQISPNDCHINGISTDQRGVRRPQGVACDIGAYELRLHGLDLSSSG